MFLVEALQQKYPTAKKTTLKRMVEARRVTVNGKIASELKLEISPTDHIQVNQGPASSHSEKPPALPPFKIIHEDDHVLVILKPPGLLTSTTAKETRATAAAKLREYLASTAPRAKLGVIHRLDRNASGLLVFSKSHAAYKSLKTQFFKHTVDRTYTAVVDGIPSPREGRIENRLEERSDGKVFPTDEHAAGQIAVTNYQTLKTIKTKPQDSAPRTQHAPQAKSLLKITLQTGRKHQIRAQFAARKTPITGDTLYNPTPKKKHRGKELPNHDDTQRLLLAATSLAFDHPITGKRMQFEVKPPKEITQLFPE